MHFPVHVWQMLAVTRDVDLRATWMSELPHLVHAGEKMGIENVERGRLGSVHLLMLSRGMFAVAELDCIGVVEVIDGEISRESIEQFVLHEEEHWQLMRRRSGSYRRPRITPSVLAAQIREDECAAAGSRKFLVADLYVQREPEGWDDFGSRAPRIPGTMVLLDYLLPALLGKRCQGWDPEDVERRIDEKKKELCGDFWFANPQEIARSYKKMMENGAK